MSDEQDSTEVEGAIARAEEFLMQYSRRYRSGIQAMGLYRMVLLTVIYGLLVTLTSVSAIPRFFLFVALAYTGLEFLSVLLLEGQRRGRS